jgi:3'-phosphoadenosine 5'-phosphosulfate sulfotransferase (PAPS reductase)/FAD synthetase
MMNSASPVEPLLTAYDVILVNSSAGKDSQAMLDLMVERAKAEGVLNRVVVVHCDLGRVEWKGTRELAEEQAQHYGLRFEVVSRTQGDLLTHVETRGMWPSNAARYCTSDHKRAQVYKLMTKLADEVRAAKGDKKYQTKILNCLGLRADESPARAKKVAFQRNEMASNGRRMVDEYLPIHDWTVAQVWARIKASGVRYHPAYDLGMGRLSCCFCVLAPKAALLLAAQHNPELADTYAAVEQKIGHQFTVKISIAQVRDEARSLKKLGVIQPPAAPIDWCAGM